MSQQTGKKLGEGKLIWLLSGNFCHSDVLESNWNQLYDDRAGLDVIGTSGVKVNVSYQGIDYKIAPWLKETLDSHKTIEVLNAPFSHALIPYYNTEMIKWELKDVIGNVPVSFLPEFCSPSHSIPTKFTLFMQGVSYECSSFNEAQSAVIRSNYPDVPAIKVADKIGIIMKPVLYQPFLGAWYRFQRDPVTISEDTFGKSPLEHLLDQIETIANSGQIVVCPLDIEAPYIGSVLGKKAYELFLSGVKARGLEEVFAHFSEYIEYFEVNAVRGRYEERRLTKWMTQPEQQKYMLSLARLSPRHENEFMKLSIASISDVLSAMGKRCEASDEVVTFNCCDLDGNRTHQPLLHNPDIIEVSMAARLAINKNLSLKKLLRQLPNQSRFIKRMTEIC